MFWLIIIMINIVTVRHVANVLIFVVSTMAAIASQTKLASVMSDIVNMWLDTRAHNL